MGLRYATVTGVARDDLPDGGAWLYAETVRADPRRCNPGTGVELLIPDFNADPDQLAEVFAAAPEVLAHNLETVPRIFKRIRPGVPLRALARRAHQGPRGRAGHQVQPDPGHGRDAATRSPPALRDLHDGRLRAHHDHPVPAPDAAAPPGGALGQAGGVRRALARRPRRSASPG